MNALRFFLNMVAMCVMLLGFLFLLLGVIGLFKYILW